MEKQPHQFVLFHVPEPPHQDARLLTRQLQQQEADYHEGLRAYVNQEQAKAYQLPLLNEAAQARLYPCLPQILAGLCWLEPAAKPVTAQLCKPNE